VTSRKFPVFTWGRAQLPSVYMAKAPLLSAMVTPEWLSEARSSKSSEALQLAGRFRRCRPETSRRKYAIELNFNNHFLVKYSQRRGGSHSIQ